MADSDPAQGMLRGLFARRRKLPQSVAPPPVDPARQSTPQVMRLRVAEFEQRRVADVMVPRAEIKALDIASGLPEILTYFAQVMHSRLPVFRATLDDPVGFVHIKDVVGELARGDAPQSEPLARLRRDVLYVSASMKLPDLLVRMQASRIHLALVVDEYGGTDGLLTLEDLVEVIVGDIEDEHDNDEPMFVRRGVRVWEADGRTEVLRFAASSGTDLGLSGEGIAADTLGGVVVALAGKVPGRGDILRHPGGADLEVLEADSRRIRRLRLHLPDPDSTLASEEPLL